MSDFIRKNQTKTLSLSNKKDHEEIRVISHALSVKERLDILNHLADATKSLTDLANDLDIPLSSVSRHLDVLEKAELVEIIFRPGPKGHTKYASLKTTKYAINLMPAKTSPSRLKEYSVELNLGAFCEIDISAPCGMLSGHEAIERFDDPNVFFSPMRFKAECLWFNEGFITYRFPSHVLYHHKCNRITFSFECCSEAPCYNNDWPSDITVIINGIEVTTFTSPGDFGGRRGKYTPNFWPISSTQYGFLKTITVNEKGVFTDDNTFLHNHVTFSDLNLYDGNNIELKIGVKADASHKGGINLFGRFFGDHPQGIIMKVK